tara:strand:- start:304 stop:747 length:444 start_codon:yes stop_codon:yes gene_type:complete
MANQQELIRNMEALDRKNGTEKLEKIIIVTSRPFNRLKQKEDNMGNSFVDDHSVTGKMMFIGNKEKYNDFKEWMKEIGEWDNVDELYIYDRYHKSGHDMIEKTSMKLHKYCYSITLKDEYKECWFNGEVSGCKLWNEDALDPDNKRW